MPVALAVVLAAAATAETAAAVAVAAPVNGDADAAVLSDAVVAPAAAVERRQVWPFGGND